MPEWLGTTIVLVVVAAIVGVILFSHFRARKQGKGGCGCGCSGCAFNCPSRREAEEPPKE